MSLLRTHDASVHRILKLLPSITPCRVQHSVSCSNLFSRKEFCSLQPKWTWEFHPPGTGLAFHPDILSTSALILLGSLDSTTAPHQVFYCHQMNQTLCVFVIFSSQCLLFCTCRWPFQNVKAVGILESFTWAEKAL